MLVFRGYAKVESKQITYLKVFAKHYWLPRPRPEPSEVCHDLRRRDPSFMYKCKTVNLYLSLDVGTLYVCDKSAVPSGVLKSIAPS